MFQLTVRGPDGSEKIYSLGADQGLLVGRDEGSDIVLASTRVSRRHARFYTTGTNLFVEDLGSQGGVFVGGARVTAPAEVRAGLNVEIGEFQIRVRRDQSFSAGDYVGTLTGLGAMQGRTLTLPAEKAIIGREAPAEIVIADDSVSRRHAEIRRLPDGSFVVRDLHSSNGTSLNNAKIPPDADRPLRPNDKVAFGETNWIVASTHVGPSADVQRSRTRVLLSVALAGIAVLAVVAFAFVGLKGPQVDDSAQREQVSLHDQCMGEVGNEHFDKAKIVCQTAYEQDPVDLELRKALRKAEREYKNKDIYDRAMQLENSDELRALDTFFDIEPASAYFAKAKIEVDRILDRQRPAQLAQCRDASKKKGNDAAVEPCTRYLNYVCWPKGVDEDVLADLKKADPKKAAAWKCPDTLKPWFGMISTGPTAEAECPRKYSNKQLAQACVSYAHNNFNEALAALAHVKDAADKPAAVQMRDDINAADAKFKEGQTQASLNHIQEARTAFDSALLSDGRIAPSNVESQLARSVRETVAGLYYREGSSQMDRHNYDSCYKDCAIAFKYRHNMEGVPKCLETCGSQIIGNVPGWGCDALKDAMTYAPADGSNFGELVTQAIKNKHCS